VGSPYPGARVASQTMSSTSRSLSLGPELYSDGSSASSKATQRRELFALGIVRLRPRSEVNLWRWSTCSVRFPVSYRYGPDILNSIPSAAVWRDCGERCVAL